MNDESTVRQFPDSPADEAYHGLADDVVRVKRVPPCWPEPETAGTTNRRAAVRKIKANGKKTFTGVR